MAEQQEVEFEEYEESWTGRIVVAVVVAVVLIAGAFFAGRALAGGGGPSTLAEAVEQAQAGDLPCGETADAAATPPSQPPAEGGTAPGGAGFVVRAICDGGGGQGMPPGGGQGGQGGRPGGFGRTGQVTAVTDDSITVSGPMGETTVRIDGSTTVNTSAAGALSDLKTGDSVLISGGGDEQTPATAVTILPAGGDQ